jgi:hypothetical protein
MCITNLWLKGYHRYSRQYFDTKSIAISLKIEKMSAVLALSVTSLEYQKLWLLRRSNNGKH